jgi:IMP dehydrogenase
MGEAITFDDVLLVPAYNHYESRKVVDIAMTDKSGKLCLQLPLMTSNMDTVTGSEMANFMAGNVATYAGADYLASCGADIIKVGIGAGSVCTTRIKTGFGVPNLTAIRECAKVDRSITADGGIRKPADIVKALAFGADFVMIGGMLAGTRPTPGSVLTRVDPDGRQFKVKEYRGMASRQAQDEYHGGMSEWKTAEGISVEVAYRETENEIIADIIGGLRSGLTYGGAANIKELQRKLDYIRVSGAGRIESLAHMALGQDNWY